MLKIYKYADLKPFSYFSITCYIAFLTSISCLFVPMFYNKATKITYSMIDIFALNLTSINVLCGVLLFCCCLIFVFDYLFQPSWISFFIDVAIIIFMFIFPLILKGDLVTSLHIYSSQLTTNAGSMLIMISAILYIAIEIYKVSIMDKFVNRYLIKKRDRLVGELKKTRKFYPQHSGVAVSNFKKHYHIRKPRIKSNIKYKKSHILKTRDYTHYLNHLYRL